MATRPMAISPPRTKIGARTGPAGRGSGSASHSAPVLLKKAAWQQSTHHPVSLAGTSELSSLGFERALEISHAVLSAAVCMHSCWMEVFEDCFSYAPHVAAQFELAAKLMANCAEQQFKLLKLCSPALWPPATSRRAASASAGVRPSGKLVRMEEKILKEAVELERQALETEVDAFEHSMDIAIGAGAA